MVKRTRRNAVVVSDDDDEDKEPHHGASTCQQRPRTNLQALLKSSLDLSTGHIGRSSKRQQRRARSPEDLHGNLQRQLLWVDKHQPKRVADLVVHKKKVSEVQDWLEEQLCKPLGVSVACKLLVLSGPPGVGKTAVVRVLAEAKKLELCEWTTPTPVLWEEHMHNAASGAAYISKLDEFEAFLENAMKFPSLPITFVSDEVCMSSTNNFGVNFQDTSTKRQGKILLLDDLPFVNDGERRHRLSRLLCNLTKSVRFPTILIATDDVNEERKLTKSLVMSEVLRTLEAGGAKKIAFNPVTDNTLKKLLARVSSTEKCRVPTEALAVIAESCAGDVRQALHSLQFLCLGYSSKSLCQPIWDPGGLYRARSKSEMLLESSKLSASEDVELSKLGVVAKQHAGRDYSISLFHALGKFLYNKRRVEQEVDSDIYTAGKSLKLELKENYQRPPLDMQEPETVLSMAHAEAATVLGFLHENALQFIDEDAADDVATMLSYMSDADCLLGLQRSSYVNDLSSQMFDNDIEPSQVAISAAGSVASRGVLFANFHPAPRRWQSLRAPTIWKVEQVVRKKKLSIKSSTGSWLYHNRREFVVCLDQCLSVPQILRCRALDNLQHQTFDKQKGTVSKDEREATGFDVCSEGGRGVLVHEELSTLFREKSVKAVEGHFLSVETISMEISDEDDIEDW